MRWIPEYASRFIELLMGRLRRLDVLDQGDVISSPRCNVRECVHFTVPDMSSDDSSTASFSIPLVNSSSHDGDATLHTVL